MSAIKLAPGRYLNICVTCGNEFESRRRALCCTNDCHQKRLRLEKKNPPPPIPDGFKRCFECGEIKVLEAYDPRPENKDGRKGKCRQCQQNYYQQYDAARGAGRKIYLKEYRQANRDYFRQYAREYGRRGNYKKQYLKEKANPQYKARAKAYAKEYNQRHDVKAKSRERQRRRRLLPETIEKERAYRQSLHGKAYQKARKNRRRTRLMAAGGTFTAADIRLQYKSQKGLCWWCGCDVGLDFHADHLIPLDRGGSNNKENIVISCPFCNMSKGNKLPWEWAGRLL